MRALQPRTLLKKQLRRPDNIYRGYLAEDYDGIGQYVMVTLAHGSTAGALRARVAAGDFGGGRVFPVGTPAAIFSFRGSLEVMLGNRAIDECGPLDNFNRVSPAHATSLNYATPVSNPLVGWGISDKGIPWFNWTSFAGQESWIDDIGATALSNAAEGMYSEQNGGWNNIKGWVMEMRFQVLRMDPFPDPFGGTLEFYMGHTYTPGMPGGAGDMRFNLGAFNSFTGGMQVNLGNDGAFTAKTDWVPGVWYLVKWQYALGIGTTISRFDEIVPAAGEARAKAWIETDPEPDWMVTCGASQGGEGLAYNHGPAWPAAGLPHPVGDGPFDLFELQFFVHGTIANLYIDYIKFCDAGERSCGITDTFNRLDSATLGISDSGLLYNSNSGASIVSRQAKLNNGSLSPIYEVPSTLDFSFDHTFSAVPTNSLTIDCNPGGYGGSFQSRVFFEPSFGVGFRVIIQRIIGGVTTEANFDFAWTTDTNTIVVHSDLTKTTVSIQGTLFSCTAVVPSGTTPGSVQITQNTAGQYSLINNLSISGVNVCTV